MSEQPLDAKLLRDPERLVATLIERGHAWADLDAAACALEETKGSVLGQIVSAHIGAGKPVGASEHLGRSSAMYQQHVQRMVEARRLANRAKVNYEAGRTFVELARTMESTRRAEMTLGGHTA